MASNLPAGIGNAQQAMQATAAMRQMPWYGQLLRTWGVAPNPQTGDVKLTKEQRKTVLELARQNGIGVSDKFEVNENGQIAKKGMGIGKKIAIGAAIGGAALTGLGAAGIGPLAGAFGAGGGAVAGGSQLASLAPAAGVGLGETAASVGLPASMLGGAGGVLAGIAGTADKVGKVGQLAGGIDSLIRGRTGDPTLDADIAGNRANQMAQNRYLQTELDQRGPAVDRTAYGNAARASLLANFAPSLTSNAFGKSPITVDPAMKAFAQSFFDKLNNRLASGQAMTLSGVPAPTPEELANREQARLGQSGQTGNKVLDYINRGTGVARQIPGLVNTGRDIMKLWS